MTASIDVTGLARFSSSLRRATAGGIQKDLVRHLHTAGPKVEGEIKAATFTRIQARAAGSVDVSRTSVGIDIAGGRGADLDATLFDGGEYGGRKSRKVVYATRSPLGRAYIVRRRTTMQFLPHLGREGYFFWPTVREWFTRLTKEQDALVAEALEGSG